MVRQTATTVILEIIGGLFLLIFVALALLAFRLSSGPLELGPLKDDVEAALSKARDGRDVNLGELFLEWDTSARRLIVTASGVEMYTGDGELAAQADKAEITLSSSAILTGNVEVLRLNMVGGWVNADQISKNQWEIAGEPMPVLPEAQLPTNLQGWLDRANEVLPPLLDAVEQAEQNLSLEQVQFTDVEVRVRNAKAEPVLTLASSDGLVARVEGGGIFINLSGNGEGLGLPSGMALSLKSGESSDRLDVQLGLAEWPLADLAYRFGVNRERIEGLPSDVELNMSLVRDVGVEHITIISESGAGRFVRNGAPVPISDLKIDASYVSESDELVARIETTRAGPFAGIAVFTLADALKSDTARNLKMTSSDMMLDFTPYFAVPFQLRDVTASGVLDGAQKSIENLELDFFANALQFTITGKAQLTPDRLESESPFLADLKASIAGDVTKEKVVEFWPPSLGTGARNFANQKISGAIASNVHASFQLQRDSFSQGYLNDEHLEVMFDVREASVSILHDLPPVSEASGSGRLTGNAFRVVVNEGNFGSWQIEEGSVDLPAFNPKGSKDMRVFTKGRGEVSSLMQVLSDSRLDIPLDSTRVTGTGEVIFELFRPMLDNPPDGSLRYSASGSIVEGGLTGAALGKNLTDARAKVDVDPSGITISGYGNLDVSPVQFTWRDSFNDGNTPSNLSATAILNPDVLNSFGLPGRAYLSGEVPVEIQAGVIAAGLSSADISMDLTNARLDLAEVGWMKPKGKPARASLQYGSTDNGMASDILLTADDARLDGTVLLTSDFKLKNVSLRRAFLADKADVSGTLKRGPAERLIIALNGPFLDASGLVPGLGGMNEERDGDQGIGMALVANVETLQLRPGLHMRGARIEMESSKRGVESFVATGKADDESDLLAKYELAENGDGNIHIESGDAGFFALALLDLEFIDGGKLLLDGTVPRDGKPAKISINIQNSRFRDAPFLTQILSLASLRGLADTLSGDGVLFSEISIPLVVTNGRYTIDGAKAQGPALGLTANGYFGLNDKSVEIDGVLVPSFGMNSALGVIPIIGDLVVGRDGEGVFSLTYAVRGELDKANVSVNPLSALTPGVIRRIFENPSETVIPEAKPRAADDPIPSELPPIPEETF